MIEIKADSDIAVNISTYTDADYVENFVYETNADTPVPIDITGNTLHFMLRKHAEDAIALFEATSLDPDYGLIKITDAANGAFSLTIPIATLQLLSVGEYVHSLIMVEGPYLLRKALWRGVLTHAAGPTRWTLGQK